MNFLNSMLKDKTSVYQVDNPVAQGSRHGSQTENPVSKRSRPGSRDSHDSMLSRIDKDPTMEYRGMHIVNPIFNLKYDVPDRDPNTLPPVRMAKVIVVFGVDTAVGAAVAQHLSKRARVRGVRLTVNTDPLEYQYTVGTNPEKEGEVLIPGSENIQVVPCNLKIIENIENAIQNADACFVHTFSNFYDPAFMVKELEQGKNIAVACRRQKIPHTVFCTQPHTLDLHGIGCRHMISKAETEEFVTRAEIPATFIILPRFYEEILQYMAPEEKSNGEFCFELPLDEETSLNMLTMEDIGPVIEKILSEPKIFTDKGRPPIRLVGDKVMRKDLAGCLGHYTRLPFRDIPVTHFQYRNQDVNSAKRRPWREDYANMFKFLISSKFDYQRPPSERDYHHFNGGNIKFEEWVRNNAEKLRHVFEKVRPNDRLRWWFMNVVTRK